MNEKGSFCISIDCELAWGVSDNLSNKFIKKTIDLDADICLNLLNIFNEYEINATWAIVAGMLDHYNPMINVINKKAWYNPMIIEKIISSKVYQEIASHSYAHPNFIKYDENYIEEDFQKAEYFFSKNNIKINSFVFPRNQIRYLNLLNKYNIKIYRSLDKNLYKSIYRYNKFFGKISNVVDKILPISSNTVFPKKSEYNLTELESSLLFISRYGYKKIISEYSMFSKAKLCIDLAIKKNECFHLWFHPSNFYYNTDNQIRLFKKIIKYADDKRKEGKLSINTFNNYVL